MVHGTGPYHIRRALVESLGLPNQRSFQLQKLPVAKLLKLKAGALIS